MTATSLTAGAGMGARAVKETMNDRKINISEMFRQGLMTGTKGIVAFASGMILATTGAYNYLIEGVKWNFSKTISMMMARSTTSFILQFPWKLGLK